MSTPHVFLIELERLKARALKNGDNNGLTLVDIVERAAGPQYTQSFSSVFDHTSTSLQTRYMRAAFIQQVPDLLKHF